MKISIITPTLNSEKTIAYTLNSVFKQNFKKFEHIIVDGGSQDKTIKILKKHKLKNKKLFLKKSSIYEAINIGIKKSTGDFILILNSDDILNSNSTLKEINEFIEKNKKKKIFLGDVVYFNNNSFNDIVRYYNSKNFKPWMMYFGLMPPHTGTIVHKEIYKKIGLYNKNFKIAGDFEFFLRTFIKKKMDYCITRILITRMRTGGVSGLNIGSHILSTKEIINSFKINNIKFLSLFILTRFIAKVHQIFIFNSLLLNKKNNFKLLSHYKKLIKYDFKILDKLDSLNFKKNFTLSALNLAFLGSFANGEIKLYNELINWPDGLFSKILKRNLKKIPGREIVKKIKIPSEIKKITILGNISKVSMNYFEKKINRKINHVKLPYGDIEYILRRINYKIKKNELIFITLPTPKQEQLAEYLKNKNKYFKIICIGGSINIASLEEKPVPKILNEIEFLWRLRYDTSRRIRRLFHTFISYIKGKYLNKNLENKSAKII